MQEAEFDLIVKTGFAAHIGQDLVRAPDIPEGFSDPPEFVRRPIIEATVSRPFRDRVFTKHVQMAYEQRCAMTGIKIVNGGGRSEAQAAHIRPVDKDGPDSVRNGISLSSTFHWMFDRGLLSVDDDFRILKAKGRIPLELDHLLKPSGFLSVPDDVRLQPHRTFLRFHRENIFKG
jgi:putative restriction endonuclease